MTTKLPADVYSPDHVGILLWELGKLISTERDAHNQKSVTGKESVRNHHISDNLSRVLGSAQVAPTDISKLEMLLNELQQVRKNAPVAHFLVPALPTRALKVQLVTWCRDNLHPQLLLTFASRADIGGGFILRVGSKQYDFTYRAQLRAHRKRLVEIFDGR